MLATLALAASTALATHETGPGPVSPSVPPGCENSLRAEAREDGVFLEWEAASEDDNELAFYRIVRDGETIAQTEDTEFLDTTVEPGVAYPYNVQAHGEAVHEGETVFTSCGAVEVTAVPFFGSVGLAAVAVAGSLGGYLALRRRRA